MTSLIWSDVANFGGDSCSGASVLTLFTHIEVDKIKRISGQKNIALFAKIRPGEIFCRPPGGENYQISFFQKSHKIS